PLVRQPAHHQLFCIARPLPDLQGALFGTLSRRGTFVRACFLGPVLPGGGGQHQFPDVHGLAAASCWVWTTSPSRGGIQSTGSGCRFGARQDTDASIPASANCPRRSSVEGLVRFLLSRDLALLFDRRDFLRPRPPGNPAFSHCSRHDYRPHGGNAVPL